MVKVFFSYATNDRDLYQIPQVAELLKAKSYIDVVFYWEGSASGSIIEYMNNCVNTHSYWEVLFLNGKELFFYT